MHHFYVTLDDTLVTKVVTICTRLNNSRLPVWYVLEGLLNPEWGTLPEEWVKDSKGSLLIQTLPKVSNRKNKKACFKMRLSTRAFTRLVKLTKHWGFTNFRDSVRKLFMMAPVEPTDLFDLKWLKLKDELQTF